MRLTLVVAVGANGVIGRDNAMPWERTGDQKQFKELTLGHPVVMGRATFDSIGRPLPGRRCIVLTRDAAWGHEGVEVAHSLAGALDLAAQSDPDVFLIGGASVYREALAQRLVDRMVVTEVHQSPEGDTWFDPIDPECWRPVATSAHDGYDIVTYDRIAS